MSKLFLIIAINFIIGALGICFIVTKNPGVRTHLLTKYMVYLLIVVFIFSVLQFFPKAFPFIALIIAGLGAIEILKLCNAFSFKCLMFFLSYMILAILFLFFSMASVYQVSMVFTIIIILDGYSQITGQLFGKYKMTPVISPQKTWEGLIGGVLLTFIASFFLDLTNHKIIIVSYIIFFGIIGDLSDSLIKRKAGIKDFGTILPGHGGILDRFDSFILSGAMYYLLIKLHYV